MIEQRKDWLTEYLAEEKRRTDIGLPERYLYEKNTRSVTKSDYLNKELIHISKIDNERTIPSLEDGINPCL